MKEFCRLLDAMLEDEKKASRVDYEKLRDALREPEDIDALPELREGLGQYQDIKKIADAVIASIATDEAKHYMLLFQLKTVLC